MMDCPETRRRVQEALDGPAAGEDVKAHLAGCPDCQAFREELAGLHDRLDSEPPLPWREGDTASVMALVSRERWRLRIVGTAAAAMILVAAGIAVRLLSSVPLVAAAERDAAASLGLPTSPEDLVREVGGALSTLADSALGSLAGPTAGPAAPLFAAGILVLLLLNGLAVARFGAARGRNP